MTSATALTPQRARELGRTLAHRLMPLPQDPARLAEAASLALLSLLPGWLQHGEESTAAALQQLVRQPCFAAYLLAPGGPGEGDAAERALQGQLAHASQAPLQPLLLAFSQGCREALHNLPAGRVPRAAAAARPPRQTVPTRPAPSSETANSGSLLGLGVAAAACFALGWLGYQLTQGLGRSTADPLSQQALTTPAAADTASRLSASQRSVGSRHKQTPGAEAPVRGQAAGSVSLACLGGSQGEIAAPADPSNYDRRLAVDWQGRPVSNTPALIVLHETVVDEPSALALFRRRHADDGQQASYHLLIGRDGRRLRVVPDVERAFGAGDSQFAGMAVQLKQGLRPSVNNIALHVSLVSPPDGADGEAGGHSGYTAEQYRSLATQIALWQASYGIPASHVVTHQEVDRSGSRRDPRSLDWTALGRDLRNRWLACGGSAQIASRMASLRQAPAPASR